MTAAPATPRRFDGKKVALGLFALIVLGTIVLSIAAYFGHEVGDVARERFEAARSAERR